MHPFSPHIIFNKSFFQLYRKELYHSSAFINKVMIQRPVTVLIVAIHNTPFMV
ncbi:hypothetical protein JCM21738_1103 [Mesobacillus boroniphilus JCM 21738]|uniref:Uncharacterized protein n=1 Tax=Mesobacillus boroniphilus JCM 21738 TaxID=1294265 RepID=W4RKI0_9BACI|nr:hypothetical protein JCM21738_1103 [Mesobacillus boroniphilus JCM 21738]